MTIVFCSKMWLVTTPTNVWMMRYKIPVPMCTAVCDLRMHAGVTIERLEMVRAIRSYTQFAAACRRKFPRYGVDRVARQDLGQLPYPLWCIVGYPYYGTGSDDSVSMHDTLEALRMLREAGELMPDPEDSEFFSTPCEPLEVV